MAGCHNEPGIIEGHNERSTTKKLFLLLGLSVFVQFDVPEGQAYKVAAEMCEYVFHNGIAGRFSGRIFLWLHSGSVVGNFQHITTRRTSEPHHCQLPQFALSLSRQRHLRFPAHEPGSHPSAVPRSRQQRRFGRGPVQVPWKGDKQFPPPKRQADFAAPGRQVESLFLEFLDLLAVVGKARKEYDYPDYHQEYDNELTDER
jgi:hypothetical protein